MTVYASLDDVPDGRYSVVYADPPWAYHYWGANDTQDRAACKHYNVMPSGDIAKMDVARIAAKDCWLCVWVTWPMLYESAAVIEGWGFKYSSCGFVWVKTNRANGRPFMGLGYTTRANSEFCLLARRGSPKVASHAESQVIMSTISRHSRKPHEARERLVRLCGDVPRIELFCRGPPAAGWDAMGDEADGGQGTL